MITRPEERTFKVWNAEHLTRIVAPGDVVKVSKRSFSQGHCTSETCFHNSHPPKMWGDEVTVKCSYVRGAGYYVTASGVAFDHEDSQLTGWPELSIHFRDYKVRRVEVPQK